VEAEHTALGDEHPLRSLGGICIMDTELARHCLSQFTSPMNKRADVRSLVGTLRLRPMLDRISRWRRLGSLLILLGTWSLLLAALQSCGVAEPTGKIEQAEPTLSVSTAETSPIATISALGALDQEPEGPEGIESPTAISEDSATDVPSGHSTEAPERERANSNTTQRATRLVIPTLGVDARVVEVSITDKTWDVSELAHEVAHLKGTANPGEKGNVVLSGHVTLRRGSGPFRYLERLQAGDTVTVYAGEQAYTYRVVDKRHVQPTDVSVTYPTIDPTVTLITCTSWDADDRTYTERVAVIAELVGEGRP
jgi:LPXTG-site transpeptidase (sortase) family protein